MSDTSKEQPTAIAPPQVSPFRAEGERLKHKFTTRDGWLGDYDYAWLCTPTLPFMKNNSARRAPPFYALNDDLPLLLAIASGLQHALAMLAGTRLVRHD